jgi:hypothetical protein
VPEKPGASFGSGDAKQRRGGDRPDDDRGTGESSSGALGKDSSEAVQDRFIQQLLLQALTPIFDPQFSESSYGFRPGRKAQDAVQAAQQYAREGKDWWRISTSRSFDQVNHDIVMGRIGSEIRDKRVHPDRYPLHPRAPPQELPDHSIRNWMSGGICTVAMTMIATFT